MNSTEQPYFFNKEISPFERYYLTDEEFEEISLYADDDKVITCLNCFALLERNKENDLPVLEWGMNRIRLNRKVKGQNKLSYVDFDVTDETCLREIRVSSSCFTKNRLENLSKYGIYCTNDDNACAALSKYLIRKIAAMPTENSENTIGFKITASGEWGYFGYDAEEGETFQIHNSYESEEAYIQQLNALIRDSVPLQFAVSLAIAPIYLAYLRIFHSLPVKSFCVNFVGKSTTGKSTAQELAASMFSSIDDPKVISPFFGTENAVLKSLDGKQGTTAIFDESTCVSSFNREVFIYSVANEQEKRRMNSDCSLRKSGTWITIPIISSEEAFMEDTHNRHQGLAVRLHKYYNLPFTKSRDHAEAIHRFCSENYGIIAYRTVCWVMCDAEEEDIFSYYDAQRDYVRKLIGSGTYSLSERLINQYAVILLSAEMLSNMGVAAEADKIAEILLEHHSAVAKATDLAKNAYEVLMTYISRNPYNTGIKNMEDKHEAAISDTLFADILRKNGFRDIKIVADELDAKGYTKRRERNRKKVKLSLNGNSCYCYLLDTSRLDEENTEQSKIKLADMIEEEVYIYSEEEDE